MSLEVIRLIYFSYFLSVLSYEIIFWGNSVHSKYIFKIQKRIVRIITNAGIRDSCFKKLQILPFYSQYIYSLLMFVVKNRKLFKLNSDIHGFGRRYDNDFHLPSAKLNLFQKGVFCSRIKTYSHLPKTIKELSHDVKQFRLALKRFII
jgi:histidinol phosphatase-like PHP family hydrolase